MTGECKLEAERPEKVLISSKPGYMLRHRAPEKSKSKH